MKVDRIYKVILGRALVHANLNRIPTELFRNILSKIYRIPRQDVSAVLHDMHEKGLIEASNCRFILIKQVF